MSTDTRKHSTRGPGSTAAPSARGGYGTSVAAELSGIGPQTLRLFERRGLLAPDRSEGGTRRYSRDDLDRIRRITELVELGVNLTGIREILALEDLVSVLSNENADMAEDRSAPRDV
ncbi:MerR family transcriptional regulator [Rhodococcus sp. W8901]|uniref:MerR family transcriptional regulator n=1 Tax=Rhodococcus sp. W8901 TaxID=2742603 RepID=UPI001581FA8E|nr:MerR family transcriptional regulator [Rhodococcus sp. W8901]QKT10407.1 MerR family transcriptional regulator [Rhodococcus sp. W8901]